MQCILTFLTLSLLLSSFSSARYTHHWWENAIPYRFNAKVDREPLQIFRTNQFTLAFNYEKMSIPHFGTHNYQALYEEAAMDYSGQWKKLPSADLELTYTLDGEKWTCVGAEPPTWPTRHAGPRIIESGRYWQRADVWKLSFKNSAGQVAQKDARFIFGMWSDHLVITVLLNEKKGNGKISCKLKHNGVQFKHTGTLKDGKGEAGFALKVLGSGFTQVNRNAPDNVKVGSEKATVRYAPEFLAHSISLHGVPSLPLSEEASDNDKLWEIPFTVQNSSSSPSHIRLLLEKKDHEHFSQRIGQPITGVSILLCDTQGRPTGIPIQHSKNWHKARGEKIPEQGNWLRGFFEIPLKPGEKKEYKLRRFHGQWGGLQAASHAQLSLIGWGMNQLWEESALGAYGESFCYEPTRAHRDAFITDIRPLMLESFNNGKKWGWTNNMGGGDFFLFEDEKGNRITPNRNRSTSVATGPCLTEQLYTGVLGKRQAMYQVRAHLGRTNDVARTTYHLKLDVHDDLPASRAVIFGLGADDYNDPLEAKIAFGNTEGKALEWFTSNKERANTFHQLPTGTAWVSLHDVQRPEKYSRGGSLASRGMIIRSYKAFIGGKEVSPYLYHRIRKRQGHYYSQAELTLPPEVKTLKKGDRIEAVVEYVLMPEDIMQYYGGNQEFIDSVSSGTNRWQSIENEARLHALMVNTTEGRLIRMYPDIKVAADKNRIHFTVNGNQTRYTPITVTGLSSPTTGNLYVNGTKLQNVYYEEDYYQTTFDEKAQTWSKTYNIQLKGPKPYSIRFK